ncbi:MAG: sel1 repeat family protein [Betaproteobacteria bacterium]|nr:sel1 repeat family protein [Betaproteobacteria bacterium]
MPSTTAARDPSVLQRHLEALSLQERGDERAAFCAFLEAGEAGYAPAQRRLAEIYSKGNSAVQRDFAASTRWYRMAREQGEAIPRPHTYSGIPGLK